MNQKFLKSIGIFSSILLMAIGCSKVKIDEGCCCCCDGMHQSDTSSSSSGSGSKRISLVAFDAKLNNEVQNNEGSRATAPTTTPLLVGRFAQIYAFPSGKTQMSAVVNNALYKSYSAGTLSPTVITGTDTNYMVIPGGSYDFYTISTNYPKNINPKLNGNGTSAPVSNGIDYISSNAKNQSIYAHYDNVNFTFKHCCAQIIFKVVGGNTNIKITAIETATMSVPDTTTSIWNLFTGAIKPSGSLSGTKTMNIDTKNILAHYIVVPYSGASDLTVTMDLKISEGGTSIPVVTRNTTITPPAGGFLAGNAYIYTLTYDGSNIESSSDVVVNWVPVYEDGSNILTSLPPTYVE
ncbi:MAG: fimbrillin family protein [Marinifilaceae bacterium]